MRHFRVQREDLNALQSALRLDWGGFWLPAGKVPPHHAEDGAFFRLCQVSVLPPVRLWIGAKSYDVGVREELFGIDVGTDVNLGDPQHERRWSPRRETLTAAPRDLPLLELMRAPREALILSYARTLSEPDIAGHVLLDRGILITAYSGRRFLFLANEAIPLDLLCTADEAAISAELLASQAQRNANIAESPA